MNIALVTSEYPEPDETVGGLGTYSSKIAGMLTREGHQVRVVALASSSGSSRVEGVELLRVRRGRPLEALQRTRFLWRYETPLRCFLDSRRVLRELVRASKREAIDVVHLASYQSPGLAVADSGRWPTITRLSSLGLVMRVASGEPGDASDRILDRLELRQAGASTRICTPSAFLAERVRGLLDLAPRIVRTPPPAPPVDRPDPGNREPLTVVFAGTGNRVKGFDVFLTAAEMLLKHGSPARFEVAGRMPASGPDRDRLETVRAGFHGSVVIHGPIDQDRLGALFRRAGCLVVPSRVDNYPNICLEAQACGCPVIASSGSSLEEMVTDGVDGLLFENGSAASLAAAISRFLGLPRDERIRMSHAAGRTDALRRRERPLEQLVSLYHEARLVFSGEVQHISR